MTWTANHLLAITILFWCNKYNCIATDISQRIGSIFHITQVFCQHRLVFIWGENIVYDSCQVYYWACLHTGKVTPGCQVFLLAEQTPSKRHPYNPESSNCPRHHEPILLKVTVTEFFSYIKLILLSKRRGNRAMIVSYIYLTNSQRQPHSIQMHTGYTFVIDKPVKARKSSTNS